MEKIENKKTKFFKVILTLAFIIILSVPLVACGEVINDHKISVTSSNIQRGIVYGDGIYKTGKEVILSATPKNDFSFVAWIKNELIVSYDEEYKFTANKETEGKYTALFTTDALEYFMLDEIKYEISNLVSADPNYYMTKISKINLQSGTTSGLYQNLADLENVEMPNTGHLETTAFELIDRIFYLNKTYYLNIKASYNFGNVSNQEENLDSVLESDLTIDFSNLNSCAEINGVKTYNGSYYTLIQTKQDGNYIVELICSTMQKPANWTSETTHTITLKFIYPFQNSEATPPAETV